MIFIYGFGPYDEFKGNVSATVIAHLSEQFRSSSKVFESTFDRTMFEDALNQIQPTHILGLGQTRRGRKLRIEHCAQNLWARRRGTPAPIDISAENPRRELRWVLPQSDICEHSDNAGTYVCNFSMWVCDEWAKAHSAQSAFLHVPVTIDLKVVIPYVEAVLSEVK